jgi:ferric-dicitrate binding protein FerR (iron transport regulator)
MTDNPQRQFEDFLLDDTFREFVTGSNQDSVAYWTQQMQIHPERAEEITRARGVLEILYHPRKRGVETDRHANLRVLLSDIENMERKTTPRRIHAPWLRIAAVIILSAGLGFLGNSILNQIQSTRMQGQFTEIIVPVGEKSQVLLADGTHVWINSGSRFTYPVNFVRTREVTLDGEAYFDVKKSKRTEFVVNTHDARIRVMGTSFNVKSYPGDRTQTTVVSGLVRVESKRAGIKSVLIRPDQMAVLKTGDVEEMKTETVTQQLTVMESINTETLTSWKDQMLVFADETFGDIAVKMERWYNIKILIEDEKIRSARYTGKFVHNETVYEVLKAIELTTPIMYEVKNNEIIIRQK